MNKFFLALLSVFSPLMSFANEATNQGLDNQINEVFAKYTGWFVNAIFYQPTKTEEFIIEAKADVQGAFDVAIDIESNSLHIPLPSANTVFETSETIGNPT